MTTQFPPLTHGTQSGFNAGCRDNTCDNTGTGRDTCSQAAVKETVAVEMLAGAGVVKAGGILW
jgi:hypothetical protein